MFYVNVCVCVFRCCWGFYCCLFICMALLLKNNWGGGVLLGVFFFVLSFLFVVFFSGGGGGCSLLLVFPCFCCFCLFFVYFSLSSFFSSLFFSFFRMLLVVLLVCNMYRYASLGICLFSGKQRNPLYTKTQMHKILIISTPKKLNYIHILQGSHFINKFFIYISYFVLF